MIYVFLGNDEKAKQSKIADLRKKYLGFPSGSPSSKPVGPHDAEKFDYDHFFAAKLDPQVLKKSLLAIPAVAKKRLILVRDCHKLTAHNQKIILEQAALKISTTLLVTL